MYGPPILAPDKTNRQETERMHAALMKASPQIRNLAERQPTEANYKKALEFAASRDVKVKSLTAAKPVQDFVEHTIEWLTVRGGGVAAGVYAAKMGRRAWFGGRLSDFVAADIVLNGVAIFMPPAVAQTLHHLSHAPGSIAAYEATVKALGGSVNLTRAA